MNKKVLKISAIIATITPILLTTVTCSMKYNKNADNKFETSSNEQTNNYENSNLTKTPLPSSGTFDASYFITSDEPFSGTITYIINEWGSITITEAHNFSATNFSFKSTISLPDGNAGILLEIGEIDSSTGIFQDNTNINGFVSIPNNVWRIGAHAFDGCTNLTSVDLISAQGLGVVGEYAFANCVNLKGTMYFPTQTWNIRAFAFQNTQIDHIVLNKMQWLDTITYPVNAFSGMEKLTKISIPSGTNETYLKAFENTGFDTDIVTNDQIDGSADASLFFENSATGEIQYITTGNQIIIVSSTNLEVTNPIFKQNITLPNGNEYELVQIGTIKNIDESNGAFQNVSTINGSISFPESIKYIEGNAFLNCENVSGTIQFPKKLIKIYENAFANDSKITNLDFSNCQDLYTIGTTAFYNIENLTSITNFPSSVVELKDHCFYGDINLSSTISFGPNLSTIEADCFQETKIKINNIDENNQNFTKIGDDNNYFVIAGATLTNKTPVVTNLAWGDVVIPSTITAICDSFMNHCTNVTGLQIPETITKIGTYAFADLGVENEIVIPTSVNEIQFKAFSDNEKIKKYTFTDLNNSNLKIIGQASFWNNSSWEGELELPNSVEQIGEHAFYGCKNLSGTFVLPNNLKTVGVGIIYGTNIDNCDIGNNTHFKKINLGEGYAITDDEGKTWTSNSKASGGLAFGDITINNVSVIYDQAFYQSQITGVEIKNCNTISYEAFEYCNNLKTVKISSSVKRINGNAFSNCQNLTNLYLSWTSSQLKNINITDSWLNNCDNLQCIHVPKDTINDYKLFLSEEGIDVNNINFVDDVVVKDNSLSIGLGLGFGLGLGIPMIGISISWIFYNIKKHKNNKK